eukprot:TRINITY_DN2143_c0_g1_i1.p1 TRINITY_DN2143_c0_g1~~TRINITY_DN2143_c0_g1_i1.p1  ORF type:complete len:931 (-),score=291.81 TRINITY_DN2143_c0_g1_i1:56-2848(-)
MAQNEQDQNDSVEKEDEEYEEEEEEGEEEDEEEEEDDDDDEGDDEEPKLKYQRLGASVTEILKRDTASCMATHERFLALGTQWGVVYVLDFNGNEIKRFAPHSKNVNELSIDLSGEFVASCSEDGKVCISALYSPESADFAYHKPISSVSMDPEFAKKSTRQFCVGGKAGQLVQNKKGWFGRADTVLHSGEGPIHAIRWRGTLIAWANDIGVKIFDCTTNQRITYIDRPKGSPRADMYRCHLCWESDSTLLIGWADSVKIGQVKERNLTELGPAAAAHGLPTRYVEIVALFQTDYIVAGIAPFGEYLTILAYIMNENDQTNVNNTGRVASSGLAPELKIVTRTNEEISCDALVSIVGYADNKPGDYRLEHLPSESMFYIVAPKDIVIARPRDLDDHISWLLDRKRYNEALQAAEANEARLTGGAKRLEEIGDKYLHELLQSGRAAEAAAEAPKILKEDAKRWETFTFAFGQAKQLRELSPYIPINNPRLRLQESVYEMVLFNFLKSDPDEFLRTITAWPRTLYNIQTIITAVKEHLKRFPSDVIMDALARLYTFDAQYGNALDIYLRLKRGNVFELIRQYQLFDAIQDKVVALMEFNEEEATKLLVSHTDRISIPQVVSQLQSHPRLLHAYLHGLFLKDAHIGSEFHELQISLYADYEPKLLLPFLRQSIHYPLEKAMAICEKRQLYPEMVFLLGRMGNSKQALKLIMEKLGDVREAIEFVEQQKDDELWEDLISQAMKRPQFVSSLLEYIGAHVDPIKLIKRIPEKMEIVGLRDRLVKIISDYNLQMSLREGCKNILKADCVHLAERLCAGLRGGVKVDEVRCVTCNGAVLSPKPEASIIVFFCSHAYHHKCLKSAASSADADTAQAPSQNNNNNTPSKGPLTSQTGLLIKQDGAVSGLDSDERLCCTICHTQSKIKVAKGRTLGARKK